MRGPQTEALSPALTYYKILLLPRFGVMPKSSFPKHFFRPKSYVIVPHVLFRGLFGLRSLR